MKHSNVLLWTAKACVLKKAISQASSLSLPTVADSRGAFLQEHESILCNTIVNRDIKIYCNNVKSAMCFSL